MRDPLKLKKDKTAEEYVEGMVNTKHKCKKKLKLSPKFKAIFKR